MQRFRKSLCLVAVVVMLLPWLHGVPSITASADIFTDITESAVIQWRHFSGKSTERFLVEAMGGGVGFLDFDGDGLLDIFFAAGGETPGGKSIDPPHNALYRNL